MHLFDSPLESTLENLVCDEILLNRCDAGENKALIRFWETKETCVVLGYGNRIATEVFVDQCRLEGVPVYRRCSGGGTVLLGTGVLNYSLVLPLDFDSSLVSICGANDFVMERNRVTLERLLKVPVCLRGCTDLVQGNLKFSGNAQRRRRSALLFHGTFLLDFEVALMDRLLRAPSLQPAYREHRDHSAFTRNIGLESQVLREALCVAWGVGSKLGDSVRTEVVEEAKKRQTMTKWLCLGP